MTPAGFEPILPASERPQTHASGRAAAGIGLLSINFWYYVSVLPSGDQMWTIYTLGYTGQYICGTGKEDGNVITCREGPLSQRCCQVSHFKAESIVGNTTACCYMRSDYVIQPWFNEELNPLQQDNYCIIPLTFTLKRVSEFLHTFCFIRSTK